ncbi:MULTISPECIES: DUF4350 domain-containing protein [unclassified Sphingopyxis]|uniref:DUF4350 domain-containing protein n=1 Tax=unclassified Sphingopyxis TaxID=2614943 RepID=UPI000735EEAD|nr:MULTISPECIES: DUF4350 domain-containing protein [unclassified Sphingopyxis]KTE46609.1 hypothetical protein ATE62_00035 [Sphingopyxis sp. HIX]KTE85050.1 hypothetical protein ATE72_05640 [Sphingopyxis sp. HXXIV]
MSGDTANGESAFNPRLMAGVVVIGIIAFIALWALVALGPQFSTGKNVQGHALSKAAPGYAGIVDLIERAGATVDIRRGVETYAYDDYQPLIVLTPTHETRAEEIAELLTSAGGAPVLIVLPKWRAMRIPGSDTKPGWVSVGAPVAPPAKLLPEAPFGKVAIAASKGQAAEAPAWVAGREISLSLPEGVQTVSGDTIETLAAAPGGGAVLARARERDVYILADPDLINNFAFASRDGARGAAMLIDGIAEDADADSIAFDVTLNGLGAGRSLLRFAFVPPFIGITLCLIAAGLFALWQAWARFGPALKPARAIAVSKAALIANSADLIKQADRELEGADSYVASLRAAIARRLHAPAGLDAAATDSWIDRHLPPGGNLFSSLARRLPLARNKHEFLADAQALHDIRKDLIRDS